MNFSLDRVKKRKSDLFLEWHVLTEEGDKQDFFGHLGQDFFILNVPFSREGQEMSSLFMSRLGAPSREPESKCGGGCSGDSAGSGLVTVYTWNIPAADNESLHRKVSEILGCKLEEPV